MRSLINNHTLQIIKSSALTATQLLANLVNKNKQKLNQDEQSEDQSDQSNKRQQNNYEKKIKKLKNFRNVTKKCNHYNKISHLEKNC